MGQRSPSIPEPGLVLSEASHNLLRDWASYKPGPFTHCLSPWSHVLVVYFRITTAGNWLFLFLKLSDICSSFSLNSSSLSLSLFLIPYLLCFSVLSWNIDCRNPNCPKPIQAILSTLLQDEAWSKKKHHYLRFKWFPKLPFKVWVFCDLCPRKLTTDLNESSLSTHTTAATDQGIL